MNQQHASAAPSKLSLGLLTLAFFFSTACGQMLPPQAQIPPAEKDSTGTPKLLDYSIPLTGVSDPGMLLSHFSQRPMLVFYFSPKCPHCQQVFPKFQQIAKEFEAYGLAAMAISVGNVKKNDVRMFMDQQNAQIPFFMDTNRKFGDSYGTGYVPLVVMVQENGQFLRFTENNDATLLAIRTELVKKFKVAPTKTK